MGDTEATKLQRELDRLERKVDQAIHRLDRECDRLSTGPRSDEAAGGIRGRGNLLWGGILLVGGLVWMVDSLGWVRVSIPWGPVVLVLIGIAILYKCRP